MSGSRSVRKSTDAPREPRKIVSVYDKMQEARARRAALLGERPAANLPTAARKPAPVILPTVEDPSVRCPAETVPDVPEPVPAAVDQPPENSGAAPAPKTSAWRRIVRILAVALSALVAFAVLEYRDARLAPAPEIAIRPASLAVQANGAPLLVALPVTVDAVRTGIAPAKLPLIEAGVPPLAAPQPMQNLGPQPVFDIPTPAAPPARPQGVVTRATNG